MEPFRKKVGFFYEERKLKAKKQNKTAKQKNNKTTKQKQQKKKEKKKRKMEYGRVYRRTKEEQALCMAKCTGGGPRSRRSKSGIGQCCAEECGPVTMHMIDVAERDRGTVCRRMAAYYIAKATARGYAGDQEGARRAFRKFLVFARADKAEKADTAQKAHKTERASRGVR
jgi:hypothetical protein